MRGWGYRVRGWGYRVQVRVSSEARASARLCLIRATSASRPRSRSRSMRSSRVSLRADTAPRAISMVAARRALAACLGSLVRVRVRVREG